MKITYEFNNKLQKLLLSKLNFFYGYNNSGKTKLAKTLFNGFNQKSKSTFLVDGFALSKNEYDVFYLDSKQNIDDQLKLTSKSLLRKYLIQDIVYNLNFENNLEDLINNRFLKISPHLKENLDKLSTNGSKINFSLELNELETLIDDSIEIELNNENECESNKRLLLYNLIIEMIKLSPQKCILISDDFDAFLDEINIQQLLIKLNEIENLTCIFFTSSSTSLQYSFGEYNVFNIRENEIFNLSDTKYIIKRVIFDKNELLEEIFDYTCIMTEIEYQHCLKQIKNSIQSTLGRMFLNRNYSVNGNQQVNIEMQEGFLLKFLLFIDQYITQSQ